MAGRPLAHRMLTTPTWPCIHLRDSTHTWFPHLFLLHLLLNFRTCHTPRPRSLPAPPRRVGATSKDRTLNLMTCLTLRYSRAQRTISVCDPLIVIYCPQALAKNFGVSQAIVQDMNLGPQPLDKEDIAVGSNALISGRDRDITESALPRDAAKWVHIAVRRNSVAASPVPSATTSPTQSAATLATQYSVPVWLPKDRDMVRTILDVYFERLNHHRPVFLRPEFERSLEDLYAGEAVQHDPGFICSVYLVLALGTLSELNHRACGLDQEAKASAKSGSFSNPPNVKKLMPPEWPEHEEFFARALAVKSELRVTVSSLQALILLQWYLYTEVSVL